MTDPNKAKRKIMRGYDKLAFGGVADAVRLMFCDNPDQLEIRGMDLFNVAEIKRPKGGGMEIKFFDRMNEERGEGPGGFYRALEQSVRSFEPDSPEGD